MIIFGGTNIYPAEIESELMKVPGVADCAVFGIPDDEFGEKVCAFIQPSSGAVLDEDMIRSDLKSRLAGYKIPRRIEFSSSESLGRVASRLVALAERFGQRLDSGAIEVALPFAQDELASWSSSSRESTARALRTLRELGLIQTHRLHVTVLDLERLRAHAARL